VTTTAADFVIGLTLSLGGNSPTLTAVSPFTGSGSSWYDGVEASGYVEYYKQGSAGAIAATFTTTVGFIDYGTGIMAFN
jgi:hypothetical protein